MIKFKKQIILLPLMVTTYSFSQITVKDSSNLKLYDGEHVVKAYSYKNYKIQSVNEVKYPVYLGDLTKYLTAEISTDSLMFYRTLFLNPEKDAVYTQQNLDVRKEKPRDSLFYNVIFKVDLRIDTESYTFLKIHKYKYQSKRKFSTIANSYIQKNGIYYYHVDQLTNKYNSILFIFKQEYLEDIFIKRASAEPLLDKLIKDNYKSGILDFENFATQLDALYKTNRNDMVKFIDPYIY